MIRRWVTNAAVFIVLIAAWDIAVRLSNVQGVVVPPPAEVLKSIIDGLVTRGIYWDHIWVTVIETLAGFAIGSAVGLALGVLVGEVALLRQTLYPYIIAFQTVPKVAVAPLFVIWFGFGLASKVAIAATISFFPIVVNVISGLDSADHNKIEMLKVFGASKWQQFWLAKAPSALPFLFAGLDIAIVLSIIGAIVAEFVGAQRGIGYLIMQYNFNLNTAGIFALLVVLSLIGVALHFLVVAVQRRTIFWQGS